MNLKGFLVGFYSFLSLLIGIVAMYLFRKKIFKIRRIWAKSMIKLIGIEVEEIGKSDETANLILSNHNSMLDIIILDYLSPKEITWIANKKLAEIPVFGWIFKLPNLILIDPRKKSSFKILMKRVKEEKNHKKLVGIFPEGTRGNTNDIHKFQKGTKLIVERLGLKVQPIILINTRARLDTKTFKATSGKVTVIYLESISPPQQSTDWYEQLEQYVRKIYKEHS